MSFLIFFMSFCALQFLEELAKINCVLWIFIFLLFTQFLPPLFLSAYLFLSPGGHYCWEL